MVKFTFTLMMMFSIVAACNERDGGNKPGSNPGGWLKGNNEEKFDQVADQLRGFDVTMVEVGYRYQELYWAGIDANWEYADYQVGKIRTAIERGLKRRPKRAASAEFFLKEALPAMEKVVKQRDTVAFLGGVQILTVNCNACHAREKVPFFTVKVPTVRQSPIRK